MAGNPGSSVRPGSSPGGPGGSGPPAPRSKIRQLRAVQAGVAALTLIGVLSIAAIGWAIHDIYGKLDNATIRLCVAEYRQWEALAEFDQHIGHPPPRPPLAPRQCRAAPGAGP
jgi:hypothetical protein